MQTNNTRRRNNRLALIILGILVLTSCVRINFDGENFVETGQTSAEERTVEWNGDGSTDIKLDMRVGDLNVTGGSNNLINTDFTWNVDSWKPVFTQNGNNISIVQPNMRGFNLEFSNDMINRWDIQLSDTAPINLDTDLGAGDSNIDLSNVNVESVKIDGGAGELDIDLSGQYGNKIKAEIDTGVGTTIVDLSGDFSDDVDVKINSGIGNTTIYVPSDIGVRIKLDQGIGSVSTSDFIVRDQDGDSNEYVNAAYGNTTATMEIDIDAGVGNITLKIRD